MKIEKLVYGGAGLGRLDGRVTLVPGVLPGEVVRVVIERAKAQVAEARAVEWVEKAEKRIEPRCQYFMSCGGCHYQHAPYEYQLAQKKAILEEVLRRVGKLEPPAIEVAAGEPWEYRNRSQFHLAGGEIGYLAAASHEVVPVERCPISAPTINETLEKLRAMLRDRRWPHFIEEIELFTNGEKVMVNVQSTQGGQRIARSFFDWAAAKIRGANAGELECAAAGEKYRVSHKSFFQVNRFLTDRLVELALEGAEGEKATDLYAGVGLFTVPLARRVAKVTGVESSASAVRDLEYNATAAEVQVEARRMQADLYLEALETAPDFVLADPPRSGLGKHTVKHLARLKPRLVTVVSCDPATLARDLAALIQAGYGVEKMTLIDLFPQTYHIETVTRLRLG